MAHLAGNGPELPTKWDCLIKTNAANILNVHRTKACCEFDVEKF